MTIRKSLAKTGLLTALFLFIAFSSSFAWIPNKWVTNTNDSGTGSLRDVITTASPGDRIGFNLTDEAYATPEGSGLVTNEAAPGVQWYRIVLTNNIPVNNKNNVWLYGESQLETLPSHAYNPNGFNGVGSGPRVEIRCPNGVAFFMTNSANCKISGLAINGSNWGIWMASSSGNQVRNCYIGTTATGEAAKHNGNGVESDFYDNLIGGSFPTDSNLISGNNTYGVALVGNNNKVYGNFIGLNRNGNGPIANAAGVAIIDGSIGNRVGSRESSRRNIISGNSVAGLTIYSTSSNEILGNYIGTDKNGTTSIANYHGIELAGNARFNRIGSTESGGRNVISGNRGTNNYGIYLFTDHNDYNEIIGNYIGVQPDGITPLSNDIGVFISGDSKYNKIGNGLAGGRNVISGNTRAGNNGWGIYIYLSNSNEVLGNYIGLDASGTSGVGNNMGIRIENGANYTKIGNGTSLGRNVFAAHDGYAAAIYQSSYCELLGNYVGTNANGDSAIPNTSQRVIYLLGDRNKIGNGMAGGRNVIVPLIGTTGIWVQIAASNEILGNYFGTDKTGMVSLSGGFGTGIDLAAGAQYNKVGNGIDEGRNVFAGMAAGIVIGSQEVSYFTGYNQILGNYIGIKADGSTVLGNGTGVRIKQNASSNMIGDGTADGRNIISGNSYGIDITDAGTMSNEVLGNYIGTNATGTAEIGNIIGMEIKSGANFNKVGDGTPGGRNIISGSSNIALVIDGSASNEVLGNFIGTDVSGANALSNGYGIHIQNSANFNKIGNGTEGGRNIISGNDNESIYLDGSNSNEVLGNYIGTTVSGGVVLANYCGIAIAAGAKYNKIGDGTSGGRNIISGSDNEGIYFADNGTSYNQVAGNYIGTDVTGTLNLGNVYCGVRFYSGASNRIGPFNIIAYNDAGNSQGGIVLDQIVATSETITQNSIFSNYGKGIALLSGANCGIGTPEITSTGYNQLTGLLQVTGTATPNAVVEIFKAKDDQGKTYLGSVTASPSGEINGSMTYLGLVSGDALVATQTDPLNDTSEFSRTKEVVVTTVFMYQPDLMIGTLESGADYVGEGIFENTPVTQVKTDSVATNESAVCYLKIKNAGNTTDTLIITGEGDSAGFTVKYFDSKTGTNELTSIATGPGYKIALPSTVSVEGRVEVAYSGTVTATKELIRTTTSSADSNKIDVIKAIAVFNPIPSPTQPATKEYTSTDLGIPGMSITVPSGATTFDATITATEVPAPGNAPVGYMIGGKIIDIQSNITQFLIPITVTIPISGPLADPKVEYWNGTAWVSDGIVIVSYTSTSITFTTTHFTIFTTMGALSSNLVRFGPNPYNPNNGSGRFWYWLDASKDTSIYLIDLGGTVTWKNTYASGTNGGQVGENNVSYDGKTSWGDILGNGVYLFKVIQDGKAIGGGKIAVIK